VQYLVLGAKARAAIAGQYNVTCAHVRDVAPLVLRHRIITNFHADAEGMTPDKIVAQLLAHVGEPKPKTMRDTEERGRCPRSIPAPGCGPSIS
jgi:MoxR-like ATPase